MNIKSAIGHIDDIGCTIKQLPANKLLEAARTAIAINPANAVSVMGSDVLTPQHLAVITNKFWGAAGVKLTVGFLDTTPEDLKTRILTHMNAWGKYSNVAFVLTNTDPQIRISRENTGYWAHLGTDNLHVAANQANVNFQGVTMDFPDVWFLRVVRHETGHILGFPHEHCRKPIVARLDKEKTYAYYLKSQGWSKSMTDAQVLTPLDDTSLRATTLADQDSVMCYVMPASITIDGLPVRGGPDIDVLDGQFAGTLYPLISPPPPPPPTPPPSGNVLVPSVVGLILNAAYRQLNNAGLKWVLIGTPPSKVASQSPIAGSSVLAGSTVTLTAENAVPPPPPPPPPSGELQVLLGIKGNVARIISTTQV